MICPVKLKWGGVPNVSFEKEEKVGDKDCYVIKSTPKAADVDYSYRLSWIDKASP